MRFGGHVHVDCTSTGCTNWKLSRRCASPCVGFINFERLPRLTISFKTMGAGFIDLVDLDDQGSGVFVSTSFPESNGGPLASGGAILAMGVKAAHETVEDGY